MRSSHRGSDRHRGGPLGDIPDRVIAELRSAIDLMCKGRLLTISALLAARSELTTPPSNAGARSTPRTWSPSSVLAPGSRRANSSNDLRPRS